jgi:hypothetical protein
MPDSNPRLLTRQGAEGFRSIAANEGPRGLWRGTSLALFGVTNGAIQFMAYEKMKDWAFARRRAQYAQTGRAWTVNDDRLVSRPGGHASSAANFATQSNTAYSIMSSISKLGALALTYPYQVVRSRIQASPFGIPIPRIVLERYAAANIHISPHSARSGAFCDLLRLFQGAC